MDGGDRWLETAALPGATYVISILLTEEGTIFAGTAPQGAIFMSENGGEGWEAAAYLDETTEVKSLIQTTDGVIYAGTGPQGRVYTSDDGGIEWVRAADPGETRYVYSLLSAAGGFVYAGADGRVLRTGDGGASWHPTADLCGIDVVYCLLEAVDGAIYAGMGGGVVCRTTDGGGHWDSLGRLGTGSYAVFFLMEDEDGAIYAASGGDGSIYRLGSGEPPWERVAVFEGIRNMYALLRSPDGSAYAAGDGTVMKFAPLLKLRASNLSPSADEPFAVEVTVRPTEQTFDAYGLVIGPAGTFSFTLSDPGRLAPGIQPLARGINGLNEPLTKILFSVPRLPAGAPLGVYTVTAGLVPPGVTPVSLRSAIPGYSDEIQVVVRQAGR
jgi:photosystem II stability/assembly factor-like uncharacterized protein